MIAHSVTVTAQVPQDKVLSKSAVCNIIVDFLVNNVIFAWV